MVDDPFVELQVENLSFQVDGTVWRYRAKAYAMLNKPAGYECSRSPRHHPSVLSLLPQPLAQRGMQPVGRLDEDTTGLLLLSDDGEFIHRMISPRHKVPKVYVVHTKHAVSEAQVRALRTGVMLHDASAAVAAEACDQVGEHMLRLTLTEGRYHQAKRMVAAAGNRVLSLQRIGIGALLLPSDLPTGAWRWLDADDHGRLFMPSTGPDDAFLLVGCNRDEISRSPARECPERT